MYVAKRYFLFLIISLTACQVQQVSTSSKVQSNTSFIKQHENIVYDDMIYEPKLDSYLLMANEEILFYSKFLDSDKALTLAFCEESDYLVCRIGTKDEIDLEFPQDKTNSWKQFTYNYYRRGGGINNSALNYDNLNFHTDEYEYIISYESYAIGEEQYECLISLTRIDKNSIKVGETDVAKIVMEGDVSSIIGHLDKLLDTKIDKNFG